MNQTELIFPKPATQNHLVLELLLRRFPCWVPMPELESYSGSHRMNSRTADLRKQGWQIENRTRRDNGRCVSEYRLLSAQRKAA